MKGFFGILNLKNGDFANGTAKYLTNKLLIQENTTLLIDEILLEDFASPIAANTPFSHLQFVGWCRLDNIAKLQSQLNLTANADEKEVILAAYQQWGTDCVKHLLGDFSFAIWDESKKNLFLAKDQMGIRPLF